MITSNTLRHAAATAVVAFFVFWPRAAFPAEAGVVDAFPAQGGKGDREEIILCPGGHNLLTGFYGRTGAWFDQIGLLCSEVLPGLKTGNVIHGEKRGGNGGGPLQSSCNANSGVRRMSFTVGHKDGNAKFVTLLRFSCNKLVDGSLASSGDFSHQNWDKSALDYFDDYKDYTHRCTGDDYAIGLRVRYGTHVNAIGLVCHWIPFPPASSNPPGAGGPAPFGKIGEKFAKLGGPNSGIGPAIGGEVDTPHGGRCHRFRHGSICWHPEIGEAFTVWGAIYDKWVQHHSVEFGYPITDERTAPDGRGRYNHFRAMQLPGRPEASIYWTPQTGAHAVWGAIRDVWAQQGWERGPLGYPTSDEHQDGKFRRVNFERGHILCAPDTGVQIVR